MITTTLKYRCLALHCIALHTYTFPYHLWLGTAIKEGRKYSDEYSPHRLRLNVRYSDGDVVSFVESCSGELGIVMM